MKIDSILSSLASLTTDTTITSPVTNNVLQYNGTKWVNVTPTVLAGTVPHASLSGITTTDAGHTQFALLAGRSGGQVLIGDTVASGTLSLRSTAHATKGKTDIGQFAYFDEVNSRLGINRSSPSYRLDVWGEARFVDQYSSLSILTETRGLYQYSGGSLVLDWNNQLLYDSSGFLSQDWRNRKLYATNGSTVTAAWNASTAKFAFASTTLNNTVSINTPTTSDTLAQLLVATGSTTNKGVVIQGIASQTANLFELQNSAGTRLSIFDSSGKLGVNQSTSSYRISSYDTAATQLQCWGWENMGGASDLNGELILGSNASYKGIAHYDGKTSGIFYITNTYDNDGGDIRFRTKGAGTPITALRIGGRGTVMASLPSNVTAWNSGAIGATAWLAYPLATTEYAMVIGARGSQTQPLMAFMAQTSLGAGSEKITMEIDGTFSTATDASRKARAKFNIWDTAAREAIRLEASGSAAMIGFLGASAAIQQTGGAQTAGVAYTATEQSMLQAAYNCLRTFGLLS